MNSTTATATSLDPLHPAINGVTRRANPTAPDSQKPRDEAVQTSETDIDADATEELRRAFRKKYRHVVAVHSESRPSCLSHDTTESPSFLGFRNHQAKIANDYVGGSMLARLFSLFWLKRGL